MKTQTDKIPGKTVFVSSVRTPVGVLTMAADDEGVLGLLYDNPRKKPRFLDNATKRPDHRVFKDLESWLRDYFDGKNPRERPPLKPPGTAFETEVFDIVLTIPYGKTFSYKEVTSAWLEKTGKERMSHRAVGQAVGKNPAAILIPCHRVITSDQRLGGYGGGLANKKFLLNLEGFRFPDDDAFDF
jgi:O-6-methylguanine DNA methyltransferase